MNIIISHIFTFTICAVILFTGCIHEQNKIFGEYKQKTEQNHDYFPGENPGKAKSSLDKNAKNIILRNNALSCKWNYSDNIFRLESITNNLNKEVFEVNSSPFKIELYSGEKINANEMTITRSPKTTRLIPDPKSAILSENMAGVQIEVVFEDMKTGIQATWQGILRDGSNYIRQKLTITGTKKTNTLTGITLIEMNVPGAKVMGEVSGSPVVSNQMFFAYEHPLSQSEVKNDLVTCKSILKIELNPVKVFECSSVIGVFPENQLRRGFLYYLERERAHPYRRYLHYNSWFDLGLYNTSEETILDVIQGIGTELVSKRNVKFDGFVIDDGWDSHEKVWDFNEKFPDGFLIIGDAARSYGAGIGVWMSPWGGYGKAKETRLENGKKMGFETNLNGFSMAGKNYEHHFRKTASNMMKEFNVNYFKFDGMGETQGDTKSAGATKKLAEDVNAILNMVGELRRFNKDLFINATVGTWPSPFWTRYADSIWRQGGDTGFFGDGNKREQWITYRDKLTYERIVQRGPLYPLNSIMFHGLVISSAGGMPIEEKTIRNEIRAGFGCGTDLQELYITQDLLTDKMWDDLAEAAKWSESNLDVMVDTHWIGGNPGELEVYGWASWNPRKGIMVIRNPKSIEQEFSFDIRKLFELPVNSAENYRLISPYKDQRIQKINVKAGKNYSLNLKPFEIFVFDAYPGL